MGISQQRMEEIERLYAGRKGKDTFVDYEIKVYKGMFSFSCVNTILTRKLSRLWYVFSCLTISKNVTLLPAHGFGARPNFAYPDVKEGFEKAFQQAVDWFNKTIPA